jgi:hypothetical protein
MAFAAGWRICQLGALQVFHDMDLKHHNSPVICGCQHHEFLPSLPRGAASYGQGMISCGTTSLPRIIASFLVIPLDRYRLRHYRDPADRVVLSRFFGLISRDAKQPVRGLINGSWLGAQRSNAGEQREVGLLPTRRPGALLVPEKRWRGSANDCVDRRKNV